MHDTKLTGPVANYLAAANAQDIEGVTASFGDSAVVRDEGQSHQGTAAIRQWAEEVSTTYRPTVEALEVAHSDDRTILTCRVSGSFPGSPIELRYVFTLNGEKIERLDIA